MNPSVLFLQNRTHRAGAQTCLERLLRHQAIRRWNPVLVCSRGGWLPSEAGRRGVPVVEERFSSSRSLPGRLYGNAAFARRVARKLSTIGIQPGIVHANDHSEGLLGLELSRMFGAKTVMFLRSPAMTRDDYVKYGCCHYDLVAAVSEGFRARVQEWDRDRKIAVIHDGIFANEIGPLRPKSVVAPQRALVIGSPLDWKGWADLTEALFLLEQADALPAMQFDFTGLEPEPGENDLQLSRLKKARCNFLGRVDRFRELVANYELVINPSRMETFGMAAIEVIAAGVPLLSSRVGVIEQAQTQAELLFPPRCPDALAAALKNVLQRWVTIDFGLALSQKNIRERFLIDRGALQLTEVYQGLMGEKKDAAHSPWDV